MAKKVKIDPITQGEQALVFFKNLKDAVAALDKLVAFNITDIEKTIARLKKAEDEKFKEEDDPSQLKAFE